ncbi:hypothetical protein [Streptomyces mirabilis]
MAAHILPGRRISTPAGARPKKNNRMRGAPPRSASLASTLAEGLSPCLDQPVHVTLAR